MIWVDNSLFCVCWCAYYSLQLKALVLVLALKVDVLVLRVSVLVLRVNVLALVLTFDVLVLILRFDALVPSLLILAVYNSPTKSEMSLIQRV